ncbi:YdiU family protein [Sporosarcina sp. HYO08]|uniref:protein adenylyltransferase SelO n=1 Tax=Sporosarcina sp. HYO08 TaxID=1759557 RepID=UPI00079928E7|nr:YdiU family protein [Sporosarcina sp. HYO08]KXH81915.1 hypothetical protein AU377_06535 [Sporosarcina sp. HYO08]
MTKNQNKAGWHLQNSYAELPALFYSKMKLHPVSSPKLVKFNESLAKTLGLNAQALKEEGQIDILAGSQAPQHAEPLAQAYAGHQFGHFTMLGDGRALLIGEQITPDGDRFDVQLKGSGRTPYSRGGDGRAALGPMLREYMISEAMHALNIPTTRSLAVVTTGEPVFRETELEGAILTRIAASHLRVGTFQFAAQWGTIEELRTLADYAIERHYPEVASHESPYLSFLQEVMKRQASLIAKWQLVGFIHGVMNTDNMTISGETIDYGPCAFMDTYDPDTVFSSIDVNGRYAYGNQPYIGGWNLARLAESLIPLLDENEEKGLGIAQDTMSDYFEIFQGYWLSGMRSKLGLLDQEEGDSLLVDSLLDLMRKNEADFTNTFRALTIEKFEGMPLFETDQFKHWHEKWQERLTRQSRTQDEVFQLMKKHNPAIIPRNHRVEAALEAAVEQADYSVMENLLAALSNPYAYTKEQDDYCTLPPSTDGPYRTFCGT